MINKLALYINTIKYLKSGFIINRMLSLFKNKIAYKIRLKHYNKNVNALFNPGVEAIDFSEEFINSFNVNEIKNDKFTFLNIKTKIDTESSWENKDLPKLWLFNLHYMEYIYALIFAYKNRYKDSYQIFKRLIINWISINKSALSNAWHPYTCSQRVVACIAAFYYFKDKLSADKDFEGKFIDFIYTQYVYLKSNIENELKGSNHYIEDLKAIIACSVFFNQKKSYKKYINMLIKDAKKQFLPDGMHIELSPMYQRQMIEALIKIYAWSEPRDVKNKLALIIQRAINAAYSLEHNTNRIPFFNDSAIGIAKALEVLLKAAEEICGIKPIITDKLTSGGYYIMQNDNAKLIIDGGQLGCSYNSAHAHCDSLSYELFIGGQPVIVNSGTYCYQKGKDRDDFRSTGYHNTVVVEDSEQSLLWSSFRAADRIELLKAELINSKFEGEIKTYLGHKHHRTITFMQNTITVEDCVENNKKAKSYLHIAPEYYIEDGEDILIKKGEDKVAIIKINAYSYKIFKGEYSQSLGKKEKIDVIEISNNATQVKFGYTISIL